MLTRPLRISQFSLIHVLLWLLLLLSASPARADDTHHSGRARSLADNRIEWPQWEDLLRVVTLQDYNTRVVMMGTVLLGISAGIVGVFMLLRRRSLIGDVVSHASLPGIAVAFIVMEMLEPGSGKFLPGLLTGALVAGLLGIFSTKVILRWTRIKEDAALALVLSVYFGFGVALFTIIQNIPTGNAAGLNQFIFGKAASLVAADVTIIGQGAGAVLFIFALLFKEFSLMSFDENFAASQGWPVFTLDLCLMGLVTGVTVIGLQSVGLLLVVAMLIIPAAAARFWTHHLARMTFISAAIGGASAMLGVMASALFPRLAAGAVIVLAGSTFFLLSMLLGLRRGIVVRSWTYLQIKRNVGRHHVLRAMFEHLESRWAAALAADAASSNEQATDYSARRAATTDESMTGEPVTGDIVTVADLLLMRSWTSARLLQLLGAAQREGSVVRVREDGYRLTRHGAEAAQRVVRNHRLWELYLIEHADIAPSHVDRDADDIEHLLGADMVIGLERLLAERFPQLTVPPSPHL